MRPTLRCCSASMGALHPGQLQDSVLAHSATAAPPDVILKPSSSPARGPTIFFQKDAGVLPHGFIRVAHPGLATPTFTITAPSCDYFALRIPLLKAGFRRLPDPAMRFPCNVLWGKSAPSREQKTLPSNVLENPFQKFNHFPRSHNHLGCKRGMALSLRKAFGGKTSTSFSPTTRFFPEESQEIEAMIAEAPVGAKFIVKPSRGSCGRGIKIFEGGPPGIVRWRAFVDELHRLESNAEVPEQTRRLMSSFVVQQYVTNPLLVDGRKLDLRLYVGVTSYDPLVAYIHREGLVRFAAEQYRGGADITHQFGHLTNYSVGRKLERPASPEEGVDAVALDLKWSLAHFERKLDALYGSTHPLLSFTALMQKAEDVVVKTLLAAKPAIVEGTRLVAAQQHRSNCAHSGNASGNFVELYGFDVMFDDLGKAWLIEVNTLPSLESSSTMDYQVKSAVVTDLLNVAMIELFDRPAQAFEANGLDVPQAPHAVDRCAIRCLGDDNRAVLDSVSFAEDLRCRLSDEHRFCGGFRRIFPVPSSERNSQLRAVIPSNHFTSADDLALALVSSPL